MAIISFCLGAASVVAASFAHKYFQDRKIKKNADLAQVLTLVKSGETVPPKILLELETKGLLAKEGEDFILTAKGQDFLDQVNSSLASSTPRS